MYLVSECTTKSAPSSKGRVASGVAKVESTARRRPFAWARFAKAAMSDRRVIGLAGLSIHSNLVSGRRAAVTAAGLELSTAVTAMPSRGRVVRASSAVPA